MKSNKKRKKNNTDLKAYTMPEIDIIMSQERQMTTSRQQQIISDSKGRSAQRVGG